MFYTSRYVETKLLNNLVPNYIYFVWNSRNWNVSLLIHHAEILRAGIAHRYSDSLRTGRSGDRIPVGVRFSAPVQTVPGAHPASCTMGTGSFLGVKRPGRGVDHPLPSNAEVEGRVELYICSPSRPSWPVLGRHLPLFYHAEIFSSMSI